MTKSSMIRIKLEEPRILYDGAVSILKTKRVSSRAFKQAVEQMRFLAEQGFVLAQCDLGVIYYHGLGLGKSYALAANFFKASAKNEDSRAQCNLAIMYYFGLGGLDQSYDNAASWAQLAANNRYFRAQGMLGYLYENGIGVAPDNGEAAYWYRLALENECHPAQTFMTFMYLEVSRIGDLNDGHNHVKRAQPVSRHIIK